MKIGKDLDNHIQNNLQLASLFYFVVVFNLIKASEGRPFYQRLFTTVAHNKPKEKYGYLVTDNGTIKRDRDSDGIVSIGMVHLPNKLRESLDHFYSGKNPELQA